MSLASHGSWGKVSPWLFCLKQKADIQLSGVLKKLNKSLGLKTATHASVGDMLVDCCQPIYGSIVCWSVILHLKHPAVTSKITDQHTCNMLTIPTPKFFRQSGSH